MNNEWVDTTLGEAAQFVNGYAFKPADLGGSSRPVIRIKQLLDAAAEIDYTDIEVPERNLISDGDLIFSWSGTLASKFWDRGPAALNQHLFKVLPRAGSDLGWLHLALDHAVSELMTKTHGTTMKHVTKKVLESHRVQRPPLPVQRRIVDLMAHLDNHLANLQQERLNLTEVRKGLLANYFARPSSATERIGDLLSIKTGKLDVNQGSDTGEFPFFTCSRDIHRIDWADFHGAAVIIAGNGDLNVRYFEGDFNAYQRTYVLQALDGFNGDLRYVYFFFDYYVSTLRSNASGTVIKYIKLGDLRDAQIPVKSVDEQKELVEVLFAADQTATRLDAELTSLQVLRSQLIESLLRGSHSIPASYDSLLHEVA